MREKRAECIEAMIFDTKADGREPAEPKGLLAGGRPYPLQSERKKADHKGLPFVLERITGLEPATSTLARWRSTK